MSVRDDVLSVVDRLLTLTDDNEVEAVRGEDLDLLGNAFGKALPRDLVEWLGQFNGLRAGPAELLSAFEIMQLLHSWPAWSEDGWVPIAGDGSGNYYLVDTNFMTSSGHPVAFVDTLSASRTPLYVAASGVWPFLYFYLVKCILLAEGRQPRVHEFWPFDRDLVLAEDPAIVEYGRLPVAWEVT